VQRVVTASREASVGEVYRADDFNGFGHDRERVSRVPGSPDHERALSREQATQSEREFL